MKNRWKVGALGAVFGAVLGSLGGCQDFDAEFEKCVDAGRCPLDSGAETDAGTADAGDSGAIDPHPTCNPTNPVDEPDPQGLDVNCDFVDGMANAGYFVDPLRGKDEDDGSAIKPLLTLRKALELVRNNPAAGRTHVYLSVGTYNEPPLVVTMPVSIHGGYRWVEPGFDYWSRFDGGTTFIDGGMLALTIQNVTDGGVLLDSLKIVSANGEKDGGASIALSAVNSIDVQLRAVTLEAGLGSAGADGPQGGTGSKGGAGGEGAMGGAGLGYGGSPGSSACGMDQFEGGEGGQGSNASASGSQGLEGIPNTPGGMGGLLRDAGCTSSKCFCDGAEGEAGDAGLSGVSGLPGDAGAGIGSLPAGIWRPGLPSARGTPGSTGSGGGGGGGGGGCNVKARMVANGSGGGGGGGGGCGGEGGQGGGAGGASIALLAFNAQVRVEGNVLMKTQGGGRGGNGGAGGFGGQGGEPGAGALLSDVVLSDAGTSGDSKQYETKGGPGGAGGRGGNGGPGGPGGGGAGGSSIVIWCSDAGIRLGTTDFALSPSAPGEGGTSDGGLSGSRGMNAPSLGCVFTDGGVL